MGKKIPLPITDDFDPRTYDIVIVAFSGGKDSLACLLHLLEIGVDPKRIELWHHEIDGREGSALMDWGCTPAYCRAVAAALCIPIYFSWREGGFEGEMSRKNTPTGAVRFESPDGERRTGGDSASLGTRGRFPMPVANLSLRWCSAYLKIMVCSSAINNQPRLKGKKILLVTGERAEESANRAKYAQLEQHGSTSRKRTVHQWRPVHSWSTAEVWAIIKRWRINPHPAYRLGWGRLSCMCCVFGSKHQWATIRQIAPAQFARVAALEAQSGCTIAMPKAKDRGTVVERAERGTPYPTDPTLAAAANEPSFNEPVILGEGEWVEPSGAFGESCGPV